MSEKRTVIYLPGQRGFPGIGDWGEKTVEEMVLQVRAYAAHLRKCAEVIEQAADGDFLIEVVRGVHVPKRIQLLQEGRRRT